MIDDCRTALSEKLPNLPIFFAGSPLEIDNRDVPWPKLPENYGSAVKVIYMNDAASAYSATGSARIIRTLRLDQRTRSNSEIFEIRLSEAG